MKKRNTLLITAGLVNILTAIIHLIGGQITLVNPLLSSNLNLQQQTEWHAAWHMVTILLFGSSYILLKGGWNTDYHMQYQKMFYYIGVYYCLAALAFVLASIYPLFSDFQTFVFAPQWILLFPIGLLTLIGNFYK